jgi:hypothetical protein
MVYAFEIEPIEEIFFTAQWNPAVSKMKASEESCTRKEL